MSDLEALLGGPIVQPPKPHVLSKQESYLLNLVEREEKRLRARDNYKDFLEYMFPDKHAYDDPTKTSYVSKPVHELMVKFWEEIDGMRSMRSALSVPPQTGKTTHTTVCGVAWTIGRDPSLRIAVGTYNETRAKHNGQDIRRLMESERYREVFPEVELEKGGKSKSYLSTTMQGYVLMLGRGSGVTGQPVDIFVVDDPVKDKAEANSTNALDEAWDWFSTTAMQRAHNLTRYVIIHTRWADNDLIGRICDPEHPEYSEERARGWTYLNVKAYNNEPHIAALMGIKPEDYIWPEKFSPTLLEQLREIMGEQDFSALYMGKPVPDEGGFFKKAMIQDYTLKQRPPDNELRIYAASDHAVSTKQTADYTVLIVAGIDKTGQVWLLDLVRKRMMTDGTVEEMIRLMTKYRIITWWAARDHISKSIGPFLRKRMRQEGIFRTFVEDSPEVGNKMQKAQSIRGMMGMGLVRFPKFAVWYADLVSELLRFRGEGDAQDDQVDAMGHLGRGLNKMVNAPSRKVSNDDTGIKFKTMAWVKMGHVSDQAKLAQERTRGW